MLWRRAACSYAETRSSFGGVGAVERDMTMSLELDEMVDLVLANVMRRQVDRPSSSRLEEMSESLTAVRRYTVDPSQQPWRALDSNQIVVVVSLSAD